MDKDILRLPSDPNSDPSSGGPRSLPFQNCSSPYQIVNNTLGPSSPTTTYSQFLPTPTTVHSLHPPPGLPPPGLARVYQFPSHGPGPTLPNYQNVNFTQEMPGASASQVPLPGHFSTASCVKPVDRQYQNGFNMQNGVLPSYPPGYGYMGLNMHHAPPMPPESSINVSQQNSCGPYSNGPFDHGTYQNAPSEFSHLGLLTSGKSSLGTFEDGKTRNDYFQPQLKSSSFLEANHSGLSLSSSMNKNESKPITSNGVGRVMNPIIENLVGSMSMCNGTYTHFGPSVNSSQKVLNDHSDLLNEPSKLNNNFESEHSTLFSNMGITSSINLRENNIESISPIIPSAIKHEAKPVRQIPLSPDQEVMAENKPMLSRSNLNAVAGADMDQQRSASPRDSVESNSRPQTPGKPSYLEVLTKAGLKGSAVSSPTRKTSSTSSSPVQSAFSISSDSAPNLAHRKSVDIFTGSTSTPSSSCPSSSSSPATKQRNAISGMKGKENLSHSSTVGLNKKQSSIDRSTPSNSPSHQGMQNQFKSRTLPTVNSGVDERKVLSSQNSSSGKGAANKTNKFGKLSTEKLNQFEDLKDDEGDWGWKTYTSRSRNNNLSNIGNKNSQKRTSSGQSSIESGIANLRALDDEDDDSDGKKVASDDPAPERKSGYSFAANSASGSGVTHPRKPREKEKSRSRKEDRNCVSRRLESLVYTWLTHLISALTWLWSLVTDVATLSASLGASLMQDFYTWTKTKALPNVGFVISRWRKAVLRICHDFWSNTVEKVTGVFSRRGGGGGGGGDGEKSGQEDAKSSGSPGIEVDKNILSLLGPERNITLPANGDEALKRLLSVKGQDPYSILGVRSDSNEETIRRYYKRQAVLVHPDKNLIVGAEEAFKILARAFEMVGDPLKRTEYHQKLMEAQAKEKFCGEIGNLLEQLRKKMEAASSTIRCTKCNSRHKKNITDRPLFAARYCSQCRIHHGAREGELWAERKGWFGIAWNYFACMDGHVWEINEWARCQKANLKHIKADAHCVMYRLVAGGNNQNHSNQHCHGNGTSFEEGAGSEADEWDSLINNLYKSPPGSAFGKTTTPGKPGCCGTGNGAQNNGNASAANQAAGKRRKGKRNK